MRPTQNILRLAAATAILVGAASAQSAIKVPLGPAPTIDGTIADAEWAGSSTFDLVNGGGLLLRHDGTHLYVGIKGTGKGWCHVYVAQGLRVDVLHASAALGSLAFTQDAVGKWQSADKYSWEMRDRTLNDDTKAKLARYLAANGWVASNSNMGEPLEMEFKIARGSGPLSIAVVHTVDGKTMNFFPSKLADDTLRSDLVRGEVPSGLSFTRDRWARLNILEKKNK
ncbi:MAG: hypothetical protein AB7J13_08710 [Pyrinomonadaceae bacterium]